MEEFINNQTIIIELLLIVSLVAIVVRRWSIPYTVILVLVGLFISLQRPFEFHLTPELILALFMPPLLFEASFHLRFDQLRRNIKLILLFAVPGVILTTLLVGGILTFVGVLPLALAFVFGALIAATDPIAVVALFRLVGAPKRLSVLVEGESLLNDGTAIVVFNIMLAFALKGQFHAATAILDFLRVSAGGLIIGLILGWVVTFIIARVNDHLIETSLTILLAFGSYLLAEQFHFSGVLAVVTAGLVAGNLGSRGMSPTTRIVIFNFWEYVAFIANSLIFLLIGLEINLPRLLADWKIILWAVVAVLAARFFVVYGMSALLGYFGWESIRARWRPILAWGGLRGAISLALALSLPAALGEQGELLRTITFGVVLFTLLIQATTMRPLLSILNIIKSKPDQIIDEELGNAKVEILRAQRSTLLDLKQDGLISEEAFERLGAEVDSQLIAASFSDLKPDSAQ